MIRINLLPVREWKRREAVRQQISLFFLTLLLLLTVLLAAGISIQTRLMSTEDEFEDLKAQKTKLAYVEKRLQAAAARRKEIENKFSAVESLERGRDLAVRVIDEVVTAIPMDRVWLTSLRVSSNKVSLSGVALDNHTVALFMRRLESSPLFGEVTLSSTTKRTMEGHELMGFGLTIKVNPPKSKAPSKEKKA